MIGRDGIAALVILASSVVLFALTLGLKENPLVPIGPGFYPRLVLGVTIALALALLVSDVAVQRRSHTPAAVGWRVHPKVALLFAVFLLYVGALPYLGFRVATLLFVGGAQAVLEPPRTSRRWIVVALVAIGTTAVTYFVFERYLSVLLPRGRWTGF
ncbi:MAG TPA: tripartite tricarboxylate transporter TctB family protein [Casimicrobiaceae bacterium]|nr:tripartite tricarboxylate transporter TctB family protein [Casimicrobiaceae bacterium]